MKTCKKCDSPAFSRGFCRYHMPKRPGDTDFYKKVWEDRPHYCEECDRYLGEEMRPVYISHILSKGAFPNLRYNTDNINILCGFCHHEWEFGSRKSMKIYDQDKIDRLKSIK